MSRHQIAARLFSYAVLCTSGVALAALVAILLARPA